MEDEFEAMKPGGAGPEMERWNLEDLQAYIDAMKAGCQGRGHHCQQGFGERGSGGAVWRQILAAIRL